MKEPRGFRNNNPLNIRKGQAWQGLRKYQTDPAFCQFVTLQYGIRAAFKLLKNYITGFDGRIAPHNTIEKIIKRWAPPSENNTSSYIHFVASRCKRTPTEVVWFSDREFMVSLVTAMMIMESGKTCAPEIIEAAYDMLSN